METYAIETDANGEYEVRVIAADGRDSRIAGRFPTWRQAQEWIDAQTNITMRNANASDVA
jgi:hypothetical protein